MNKELVIQKMKECEQTEGQTLYQHGLSVQDYFLDLYNHLTRASPLKYQWQLPEWLVQYREQILFHLLPVPIILEYTLFHDIGKPFCITYDDEGKKHFPDHAKVSYDIWMQIDGREDIGKLILMDMDIHTLKKEDVDEFILRPECVTLLLVGLSELHSNASMFGGIDSVSFKIKYKKLNKIGKQICDKLFSLR